MLIMSTLGRREHRSVAGRSGRGTLLRHDEEALLLELLRRPRDRGPRQARLTDSRFESAEEILARNLGPVVRHDQRHESGTGTKRTADLLDGIAPFWPRRSFGGSMLCTIGHVDFFQQGQSAIPPAVTRAGAFSCPILPFGAVFHVRAGHAFEALSAPWGGRTSSTHGGCNPGREPCCGRRPGARSRIPGASAWRRRSRLGSSD